MSFITSGAGTENKHLEQELYFKQTLQARGWGDRYSWFARTTDAKALSRDIDRFILNASQGKNYTQK